MNPIKRLPVSHRRPRSLGNSRRFQLTRRATDRALPLRRRPQGRRRFIRWLRVESLMQQAGGRGGESSGPGRLIVHRFMPFEWGSGLRGLLAARTAAVLRAKRLSVFGGAHHVRAAAGRANETGSGRCAALHRGSVVGMEHPHMYAVGTSSSAWAPPAARLVAILDPLAWRPGRVYSCATRAWRGQQLGEPRAGLAGSAAVVRHSLIRRANTVFR